MTRALPLVLLTALASGCATTSDLPPEGADEVVALESALEQGEGEPFDLRIQLASACLDVVDHPLTGSGDKLRFSKQALAHADAAIRLDVDRVEGHYYRAVSLGQVLDNSTLPDLGLIGELEAAGVRAREIDPGYKNAGPLRFLALLYQKAPAWPIGPELAGEVEEIEALFNEAVERAPECVQNHLAFAEFLFEEERKNEARRAAQRAEALLRTNQDLGLERQDLERRVRQLLAALKS